MTDTKTQADPAEPTNDGSESSESLNRTMHMTARDFREAMKEAENRGYQRGRESERKSQLVQLDRDIAGMREEFRQLVISQRRTTSAGSSPAQAGDPILPEDDFLDTVYGEANMNKVAEYLAPADHSEPEPQHFTAAFSAMRPQIPVADLDDTMLKQLVAGTMVTEYVDCLRVDRKFEGKTPADVKDLSEKAGNKALRLIEQPGIFSGSDPANLHECFVAFVYEGTKA